MSYQVIPPDYQITKNALIGYASTTRREGLRYRDMFMRRLSSDSVVQSNFLFVVDGMVAGVCGLNAAGNYYNEVKHQACEDEYIWILYSMSAYSIRHNRLNKLMLLCAKCDSLLNRFDSYNRRARGFETTCLSRFPESKQMRGVAKLINREKLKSGDYRLVYRAERTQQTYGEVLSEWIKNTTEKISVN